VVAVQLPPRAVAAHREGQATLAVMQAQIAPEIKSEAESALALLDADFVTT